MLRRLTGPWKIHINHAIQATYTRIHHLQVCVQASHQLSPANRAVFEAYLRQYPEPARIPVQTTQDLTHTRSQDRRSHIHEHIQGCGGPFLVY